MQDVHLSSRIPDIGTASTHWVVCPIAGFMERLSIVRGGSLSDDETVSVTVGAGATIVILMAAGGSAGGVTEREYTGRNEIAAGDTIKVENAGASSDTEPATVAIVIRRL